MKMSQNKQSEKQIRTQEFTERRALFFAALEVLKAKKAFLMLTFALALTGTVLGHYFHETTYTSQATVFVQALEDPTAAEYLLNQHVGRTNKAERIETYMRYLSSDGFFMSVAQRMKFQHDIEKIEMTAPKGLSVVGFAFWKNQIISMFQDSSPDQTPQTISQMSLDELVGTLKQITSYETDYSHFIHIKTKTLTPKIAQIVANEVAEEFVNLTNARGIQEIEQIKVFVQSKLEETQERIKKNEIDLIDFKKKNSIISTDSNSQLVAERYNKIASQLETAKLQLEENQKLISFFEKGQQNRVENASSPSATQVFGVKETAMILQRKLEQLKKEKGVILAQEDKNQEWRIKEIDAEIGKTLKAFKSYSGKLGQENLFLYMNPQKLQQKINELKEENEILKTKITTNSRAMAEVKSQIEGIPVLAQKQFVLENDLRVDNENYINLKNKLTELEIQRISQKKEVRVDQVAGIGGPSPRGNLALKVIFSALIALFLGMSIIIGIEMIDPTVKHRSDLNDCGIEFIGEIPLIDNLIEGKKSSPSPHNIICNHAPESIEAMAFKYIRARLESYKYKFKKEHLIISISSSAVHEGKSFVSANVAVSIANLKRSVLLIDCDLRRPSQNAYFEVAPQHGLVDLLNMEKTMDEVLINDVAPGLDYIPAGFCRENPTEYISSEKFKALISFLKPQYDYIVIDTPPVFAAVDSAIIASYSDIPILIANFRETKKYHLNESYNHFTQVSYKKVYGIINKAIVSTARFHYYGYHSYHKKDATPLGPSSSPGKNNGDIDKFIDNLKKKTS